MHLSLARNDVVVLLMLVVVKKEPTARALGPRTARHSGRLELVTVGLKCSQEF